MNIKRKKQPDASYIEDAISATYSCEPFVPEHIHSPTMEGFLNWTPHPSRNSILVSYFHSKNWAFETLPHLGISINLPWGGHGYLLELHI